MKMIDEVQIGLGFATAESIHGSLLIIRELVLHANMVRRMKFIL
jgi:FKBP12-rapamycin complex-associated protein